MVFTVIIEQDSKKTSTSSQSIVDKTYMYIVIKKFNVSNEAYHNYGKYRNATLKFIVKI